LCDAPPPPDSWIAVETSPVEYRLVARLPGFRRDAITLAARRRRVLHVVADSWEPGGGHFERRISFGYDADLSPVRAEFDGEILRVIVPRRTPLLTWYGEACE
jgi:HSP20 family molecular chaperone IbpA